MWRWKTRLQKEDLRGKGMRSSVIALCWCALDGVAEAGEWMRFIEHGRVSEGTV